jgi:fermentation-respiration switch protein FrsA (DUF1100 family)
MRILVLVLLGSLAVVVGVLLFGIWKAQRALIYFPDRGEPRSASTVVALPGATDVAFETADGLTLEGWFVPAPDPPSGGAVLVFNGNAGNRSYRADIAGAFRRSGLAVLLFDYRGYGGNPGEPSEEGLILDGRAARRYLTSRPDVDPGRLIYYGESLGAAVAVAVAAADEPAALILCSPFTSLVEVGRVHYPWLPVGLLLRDRWLSIERIRHLDGPLVVIAGDRDEIVPYDQSVALFHAAPQELKTFFEVQGAQHNDRYVTDPSVMERVTRFLGRHTDVLGGMGG